MRILFVLYGGLSTNTFGPLSLFAKHLNQMGHECAIAIPDASTDISTDDSGYIIISYKDVFVRDGQIFRNGATADIIHACTPRIIVFEFIKEYMNMWPTPLAIYLEDNEKWISQNYLAMSDEELMAIDDLELYRKLPSVLSHPFDYKYFISLADSIILIQEKISSEVPSYIPAYVIPWGVDLDLFHPNVEPSIKWRDKFLIKPNEKIIVYHGGLNGFTRPAMIDLSRAVILLNEAGVNCKLIRSGVNPINFWDELSSDADKYIFEAGVVDKVELPGILALADVFVQPGRIDPFEDLRLPSKLPEFLSMGRPVILPNVNIANLFIDGTDVILLKNGDPQEIADACLSIFESSSKSIMLGKNARIFSEKFFDIKIQALHLETAYIKTIANFKIDYANEIWRCVNLTGPFDGAIKRIDLLAKSSSVQNLLLLNQAIKWAREMHARLVALNYRGLKDAASLKIAINDSPKSSLKFIATKFRSLIR